MADSPLLQLHGHWEQTPSFPMHPSRFWLKPTPPCLVPFLLHVEGKSGLWQEGSFTPRRVVCKERHLSRQGERDQQKAF